MTDSQETSVAEVSVSTEEALEFLTARLTERGVAQVKAGVINPIELAKALDVRPQMLYSYIRDGRLKAFVTPDTQKLIIRKDDAVEYVRKRLERTAKAAASTS
jgi:hypothetical protein